jgi:hypothetical protein
MNISAVSTPMRKSQASARSVAPPSADRRNAEILQPIDHDLERAARGLFLRGVRAFGNRAEIVSGAEGASRAGQYHDAERGIGFDPVEQS